MTSILMLALALAFLLGGLWIGWLRWVRPYQRNMSASCQSMLALTIVTVAGGLIGSLFWWMDAKASFPWTLSLLASRMLASAGVGFAAAGIFALERRQDRLIRLYLVLLTTYLAPLIVVIILFHLDRFNWRAPITYAFFLIAIGMTAAALWHLARKTSREPRQTPQVGATEPTRGVRLGLALIAFVAGLWGLALYVWPDGPSSLIWIWRWDPLTSRLIAVMLFTLCMGGILGRRDVDGAKMVLLMFALYGVGVTTACLLNLIAGEPTPPAYSAAFATLTVAAGLLLLRLRAKRGSDQTRTTLHATARTARSDEASVKRGSNA